jgi:hypothetical protein
MASKKGAFQKADGKVAKEVIVGIRKQYSGEHALRPVTSLDMALINLKQVDLLEEIRDLLQGQSK